jgi:hypothetical protein
LGVYLRWGIKVYLRRSNRYEYIKDMEVANKSGNAVTQKGTGWNKARIQVKVLITRATSLNY